jgi:hypothetical protein
MKSKILSFIKENNLSAFNSTKSALNLKQESVYKTRDAKSIHIRTLQKISQNFIFADTANIFNLFTFTKDIEELIRRQNFFREISQNKISNKFLEKLKTPKSWWKPRYDVLVVTEDAETFTSLKKMGCPAKMLVSESDVSLLESCDVVQIIKCDEFSLALESLPQAVFFKKIDEVYLERYLELFSGWIDNLNLLNNNIRLGKINEIVQELIPLTELTNSGESNSLDPDKLTDKILEANSIISEKIKQLTLSGASLVDILSKRILPIELKQIVEQTITELNIPRGTVNIGIPLSLDEEELNNIIQRQTANEFSSLAEKVKENSNKLKNIPKKLEELSDEILFFDFVSGISQFINSEMYFPEFSEELLIENSKSLLIENPKPISFRLSEKEKCSILTGANSGGKTTLIEHILQLISLSQIGLPLFGKIRIPLFSEVYYFAKNKGSMSKGAFETLLTQMSEIKPGNKTFILADEIESVTEPGVAGNIIAATADYYIKQNCFLIIATHLGYEIQKMLPANSRIDGIEAKGLTENFDLIVNHNPVLGRLAHSTPELIVEKMANKENKEYFKYLHNYLKSRAK